MLLFSELDRSLLPSFIYSLLFFVAVSWLSATLPTCAMYQPACSSIHMPAFCHIIFFTNYGNLVSLMQLRTPRYAFDGNTFGTTGSWDPLTLCSSHWRENKNIPEIWAAETHVFDSNSKKSDFDVCIKQQPVYNGMHRANMQRVAMQCNGNVGIPKSETMGASPKQIAPSPFTINIKNVLTPSGQKRGAVLSSASETLVR